MLRQIQHVREMGCDGRWSNTYIYLRAVPNALSQRRMFRQGQTSQALEVEGLWMLVGKPAQWNQYVHTKINNRSTSLTSVWRTSKSLKCRQMNTCTNKLGSRQMNTCTNKLGSKQTISQKNDSLDSIWKRHACCLWHHLSLHRFYISQAFFI